MVDGADVFGVGLGVGFGDGGLSSTGLSGVSTPSVGCRFVVGGGVVVTAAGEGGDRPNSDGAVPRFEDS